MAFRNDSQRKAVMAKLNRPHNVVFVNDRKAQEFAEYLRYKKGHECSHHEHPKHEDNGYHVVIIHEKNKYRTIKEDRGMKRT